MKRKIKDLKSQIIELKNIFNGRRKPLLILTDFAICFISYLILISAPYSGKSEALALGGKAVNFIILYILLLGSRLVFGAYSSVWRYARSYSYLRMILADFISGAVFLLLTRTTKTFYAGGWRTLTILLSINLGTLLSRFVYQQLYTFLQNGDIDITKKKNVAIIGAGRVGAMLAEELRLNSRSRYTPYIFVDNDPEKIGQKVSGISVIDSEKDALEILANMPLYEVIIATPFENSEERQRMYNHYSKLNLPIKIYDFAFGEGAVENGERKIRKVKIEDLLFRKSVSLNTEGSRRYYNGKTVLVTGGGGSIGSDICRQIAKAKPKQLIILDIYENNAYDIQQELLRAYGDKLDLVVEIGTVRDKDRIESIFKRYRPEIVFHAAAHKHVPLMEYSSCEAIKNNVFGTYNTANMAEKYGAEKFILISTDKAVNPTNIMGATKRMCEMIVQSRKDSKTSFAAVRFGNVLGSNGSVIPLFTKQIEDGGPVTITDKRIIRYFMTISEASQLVLHSGVLAKRGELFVLDMGKPIRILELAENMIRLSGFKPYDEIDIVEVGLRPGEKLYEELLIRNEEMTKTENDLIFIEKDEPYTRAEIEDKLDILGRALIGAENKAGSEIIKDAIKEVVPDYREPEEVNCDAEKSEEMMSAAHAAV